MTDVPVQLEGDRYQLVGEIGRGGMARVWKAWDRRLRVWRAIKILDRAPSEQARARFENEAHTMARLHHPHILPVHDVGVADGRPYIVMDLAHGSLVDRAGREPLPPRLAVGLIVDVLDALQYAHDNGVVHRDIKPHNLLLSRQGRPLVADFGIARVESVDLTHTGATIGTLAYMAPEQRAHAGRVDGRADLYAAGGTLYALLTRREPLDLYLERPGIWDGVPASLRPLLQRATAYEREDRFASAAAFREALLAVVDELPGPDLRHLALDLPSEDTSPPPSTSPDGATFESAAAATYLGTPPPAPRQTPHGSAPVPRTSAPPPSRARWVAAGLVVVAVAALAAAAGLRSRVASEPTWAPAWSFELDAQASGGAWFLDDDTVVYDLHGKIWKRRATGPAEAWFDAASPDLEGLLPDGSGVVTGAGNAESAPTWIERPDRPPERLDLPDAVAVAASPDGGTFALDDGANHLVFTAPGGSVVRSRGGAIVGWMSDLCWSPDARYVLVGNLATPSSVFYVPVDGSAPHTVASEPGLALSIGTVSVGCPAPDRLWYGLTGPGEGARLVERRLDADGQPLPGLRTIHRASPGHDPVFVRMARSGRRASVEECGQTFEVVLRGPDGAALSTTPVTDRAWPVFGPDGELTIAAERGDEGEADRGAASRTPEGNASGEARLVARFADGDEVRIRGGHVLVGAGGSATPLFETTEALLAGCRPSEQPRCVIGELSAARIRVRTLDTAARRVSDVLAEARVDQMSFDPSLLAVTLSPDGRLAYVATGTERLRALDLSDGTERNLGPAHTWTQSVAVGRDGRVLATAVDDVDWVVFDVGTGEVLERSPSWVAHVAADPVTGRWAFLKATDHTRITVLERRDPPSFPW